MPFIVDENKSYEFTFHLPKGQTLKLSAEQMPKGYQTWHLPTHQIAQKCADTFGLPISVTKLHTITVKPSSTVGKKS